jgi:hypothetical protein
MHGPEFHLRAFVGLWEAVQENAGNWPGWNGLGDPLPGAQLASGLGGEGGLGEDPNPPSSQILLFGK